jgi:acyl carrier protein
MVRFSYYFGKNADTGVSMTNADIEKIIIETLLELQAGSEEPGCEITPKTAPLIDLGFFDSLLAIETTIALEEKLGCSCGEGSVFKQKGTKQPLTISEIALQLAQISKVAV